MPVRVERISDVLMVEASLQVDRTYINKVEHSSTVDTRWGWVLSKEIIALIAGKGLALINSSESYPVISIDTIQDKGLCAEYC